MKAHKRPGHKSENLKKGALSLKEVRALKREPLHRAMSQVVAGA